MPLQHDVRKRQIGNVIETRITITKTGKNKNIESKEVRSLYKEFKESALKADKNAKLLVVGDNPLQDHWTLKGFQNEELDFEDYEDYFDKRVKDPSKFAKFTGLTFVTHIIAKANYKAFF